MRALELALGAVQTALGLAWLALLWIDRGREPAKRQVPRARLFYALLGMCFLLTGPWWIVRGLGG